MWATNYTLPVVKPQSGEVTLVNVNVLDHSWAAPRQDAYKKSLLRMMKGVFLSYYGCFVVAVGSVCPTFILWLRGGTLPERTSVLPVCWPCGFVCPEVSAPNSSSGRRELIQDLQLSCCLSLHQAPCQEPVSDLRSLNPLQSFSGKSAYRKMVF